MGLFSGRLRQEELGAVQPPRGDAFDWDDLDYLTDCPCGGVVPDSTGRCTVCGARGA